MYLICIAIVATYLIVGALLYVFQRNFIYFPSAVVNHGLDEIVFENEGEKIRVISVNAGAKKAILYFGGNAESVVYNVPDFQMHLPSFAVFLVNYRGYAGSTGTPTERALYSDALSIYDELAPQYDNIVVVGRSLGSGVATYLAANRPVKNLILVTPFDSIQNVAQSQYPIYPMSLMLKDKFNSVGRAHAIEADILVLIAARDKVIGKQHSTTLVDNLKDSDPKVVNIDDAGHNDITDHNQYYKAIKQFLDTK